MDSIETRFRKSLTSSSRGFRAGASAELRTLGVHPGQNFLLEALVQSNGMTTGDIAHALRIENPTATRMAQRMEAAGLVERTPDIEDRRRVRLTLTDAGRVAAERVPEALDSVSRTALAGFTPQESEQLVALIERAAANLGWGPSASSP
jgi:DNA-binding MarR family transcriptional regulator